MYAYACIKVIHAIPHDQTTCWENGVTSEMLHNLQINLKTKIYLFQVLDYTLDNTIVRETKFPIEFIKKQSVL